MIPSAPVTPASPRPRVAVVFTGGTIAMRAEPGGAGAVPALDGHELVRQIPALAELAEIETHEFDRLPGPHMTLPRVLDLARLLHGLLENPGIDGIVVTHGTDTLEESAYLLHRLLPATKPVVLTGAMRPNSDRAWDGATNLYDAVRVAASNAARTAGVVVVLHGDILPGATATKRHTDHPETFGARDGGILGTVDSGGIHFFAHPEPAPPTLRPDLDPAVDIIPLPIGSDGRLIDLAVEAGTRGLVLQALGCGNVPVTALPSVHRALARGVPVVVCTRCWEGPILTTYGYPGSARTLETAGAVLAGRLPAHKARLELMLLLGNSVPRESWTAFHH